MCDGIEFSSPITLVDWERMRDEPFVKRHGNAITALFAAAALRARAHAGCKLSFLYFSYQLPLILTLPGLPTKTTPFFERDRDFHQSYRAPFLHVPSISAQA